MNIYVLVTDMNIKIEVKKIKLVGVKRRVDYFMLFLV